MSFVAPDPTANPYLAYAVLIYAGLDGIKHQPELPDKTDIDIYSASEDELSKLEKLPESYSEAAEAAVSGKFLKSILPFDIRALLS